MKKTKSIYQTLRKYWEINPRTRIREDKNKYEDDPCARCQHASPQNCYYCEEF